MDKINFQNLPNTTTPVNATNLNQLQTNVENGILNSAVPAYNNSNQIDPNTTIEPLILTKHNNGPDSSKFYYIETRFFVERSTTRSRVQTAYGYTTDEIFERHYYDGAWSGWQQVSPPQYISNSNGKAIKFADGSMICYLNITKDTISLDSAYGNLYIGNYDWVFPVEFYTAPVVTCGCFLWGSGASWGSVRSTTTTYARLRGYDIASRASGTDTTIQATAIGRWKA